MNKIVAVALISIVLIVQVFSKNNCKWHSKSVGATFNLEKLMISQKAGTAYQIIDGDIPCTPEVEPAYGYAWNLCDNVPEEAIPEPCLDVGKSGAVLQFAKYSETDYYCFIIGHYNPKRDSLYYNLLDRSDPTKGVSVRYPAGEKCSATNTKLRTATIDIQCANTNTKIVSAQEPDVCDYHLVMKSIYGCPTECAVTKNGLCDSHGICAYDKKKKESYCYCNEGYSGSKCDTKSSDSTDNTSYDGYSVQIGLLITLLVIAAILTGGVIYLSYRMVEFRKQQTSSHYSSLPGGETEMTETVVSFR